MKMSKINTEESNTNTALYKGETISIITIFKDRDIAVVEDSNGNIFDVKSSLLSNF